jgi:Uma2 family endonuclease
MGVPLYWILDPESRRAEIWTPEAITPVIESERLLWLPAGAVDPLVVDLSTAFAGRT